MKQTQTHLLDVGIHHEETNSLSRFWISPFVVSEKRDQQEQVTHSRLLFKSQLTSRLLDWLMFVVKTRDLDVALRLFFGKSIWQDHVFLSQTVRIFKGELIQMK